MVTPKIEKNICLAPDFSSLYRESRKIPECLEPLSLEEEYQKFQRLTGKTSTLDYVLGGASAWLGCAKANRSGYLWDGSIADGPDGALDGPRDGTADRSMIDEMSDVSPDGMRDAIENAAMDGPIPNTLQDGPLTDGMADGMTDGPIDVQTDGPLADGGNNIREDAPTDGPIPDTLQDGPLTDGMADVMTDGAMSDATDGPMSDIGIDAAMSDGTVDGMPDGMVPDAPVYTEPACLNPLPNTIYPPDETGVFSPLEWAPIAGVTYLLRLWKLSYMGSITPMLPLLFEENVGSATSSEEVPSFPTLDYRTDYLWEVVACSEQNPADCLTTGICQFTTTQHGLIGWWRFNEEEGDIAYDWSGYGNDGTLMGEGGLPPIRTSGIASGGLFFDGINDYVAVGNQDILGGMGGLTVEVWTNTAPYPEIGGNLGVVSKWFEEPNAFLLRTDKTGAEPRKAAFSTDTDPTAISTNPTSISGNRVDDGVWHYLAATYNGSIQRIYMDSVLEAASIAAQTGTINDSPWVLCFGAYCNIVGPVGGFFKGVIDEIAIYNRALEPEEIFENCERNDSTGAGTICP